MGVGEIECIIPLSCIFSPPSLSFFDVSSACVSDTDAVFCGFLKRKLFFEVFLYACFSKLNTSTFLFYIFVFLFLSFLKVFDPTGSFQS